MSWPAVIAGAFVATALSLILLALGTGLGPSSISPWVGAGASGTTVGRAAIVWLIVVQILASAMGGYLAGRLRIRWPTIHTDEVYFRDTAHGFLAWAAAVVITGAPPTMAAAAPAKNAKAAGVMPQGIVPRIRTLIGGRRAQDVQPESVRIRADLVTWGIEGYYAAS